MSPSANCAWGIEKQTANHIVLECRKLLPPNGACDLTAL